MHWKIFVIKYTITLFNTTGRSLWKKNDKNIKSEQIILI